MNLVKSTGTFGFYTIISRLLGYLRDVLIAIFLGTSFLADAFFVAFRIPNTFRRLFAEGTFNAAFVPSYTSELVKSKSKSKIFANEIFNLLFLGLFFLILIIEFFMPAFVSLIAPGFVKNTEKIELVINLTRITFPFLIFVSLSSFFAAILNSHNKFAVASAAPIILNLVLIGILFFGNYLNDALIYYLSYGVSIAGLLQLIFLYKFVKKFHVINFNFKFKINNKVKFFFKKLIPSIFSSGVTQINILVGTIIASFQAGAVSYLYYADRVYQINLAISGIAVGTVMLPQLSKYIKNNNKNQVINLQNRSIELSLFLSIPGAVALIMASKEIVTSLFGYGSFDIQSVNNTAIALTFFAFGVPAFSILKIFSNLFFARNDTKLPFYLSIVSVILNIILSVLFFNRIGFVIIPIATSISSWINVFFYFYFIRKRNLYNFDKMFIYKFPRIILSVVVMAIALYLLLGFFSDKFSYNESWKFIYLFIIVIISLFIYFLTSNFSGAFKFKDIKLG